MEKDNDKWNVDHSEEQNNPSGTTNLGEGMDDQTDQTIDEIITGQLHKNLVLFAGPREVGKTVTLFRLIHFLKNNRKTKVLANRTFRKDKKYQDTINEFLNGLNRPDFNAKRTANIDFMVLDVFKNSKLYCQFLEAPGEAYFDPKNPHSLDFPAYMTSIFNNSKLNKVFVIFFEEGMLMKSDPRAYSARLARLVTMMNKKKDDVIILYNKCDLQRNLYHNNKPNVKEFKNILYNNNHYSDFFGAISELGIPVKFVPFSSGDFKDIPGKKDVQRWIHSDDYYPSELWKNIDKCFKSISFF